MPFWKSWAPGADVVNAMGSAAASVFESTGLASFQDSSTEPRVMGVWWAAVEKLSFSYAMCTCVSSIRLYVYIYIHTHTYIFLLQYRIWICLCVSTVGRKCGLLSPSMELSTTSSVWIMALYFKMFAQVYERWDFCTHQLELGAFGGSDSLCCKPEAGMRHDMPVALFDFVPSELLATPFHAQCSAMVERAIFAGAGDIWKMDGWFREVASCIPPRAFSCIHGSKLAAKSQYCDGHSVLHSLLGICASAHPQVAFCSFLIGFVFMVLLRFLIRPCVWSLGIDFQTRNFVWKTIYCMLYGLVWNFAQGILTPMFEGVLCFWCSSSCALVAVSAGCAASSAQAGGVVGFSWLRLVWNNWAQFQSVRKVSAVWWIFGSAIACR